MTAPAAPAGRAIALLSDHETTVDLLNNETIAKTIIALLRERPELPVTVGVHGDWGAGKSSLLEMICVGLGGNDRVLCIKFNGWRLQGFEDAKIVLIEGIVSGLLEKRPALTKATDSVKAVFRRLDLLKVAKKAGGLALTVATGLPAPDQIRAVATTVAGVLSDPGKLADKVNVEAALEGACSLLKDEPGAKNVPEEIDAFRKAFDDLLVAAGIDQLVVLIDDLDRCLPDTAIETLEAIRLFVFTPRTAFVVAADEGMIEYAVRRHFPDLPESPGSQTYARNYLEKLIQVPFRIPSLGESETRTYVTLLLVGAELGEGDKDFRRLIDAAREKLRRPWEGGAIDAASLRGALGGQAAKVQGALTLSDQIGPTLATGTKGNPRQIKRFLNTLMLRKRIAEARGFGETVKVPVLGKLMLAERFIPRLFEQLATVTVSSPNGVSPDVAALERAARGERASEGAPKPATRGKPAGEEKDEDKVVPAPAIALGPVLTEWLGSDLIRQWARVEPSFEGVDLRPYLFVSREKKDLLGGASILGHLERLAEQLMGPRISVQGHSAEVGKLAAAEAGQVFERVRARILASDAFETEPPGVAGLAVLVETHPALEGNLVDFLDGLPVDRLGPWPVAGWERALREKGVRDRFDRLRASWAASANGGSRLKAAVVAALKLGRKDS